MRTQEIFRSQPRIEGIGDGDFRLGILIPEPLGIQGLYAEKQDKDKNESFHVVSYL